ncbi:MAG: type II toxin-antitoxin system VapC family toxin [Gemmatimonadetes bacterium]|jgi:tRNA(fMet)-specific endonuclease VapC|nr:type II toxin-antitoxin system VapC family toxin [Gemmatimonadota bacterium]
MGFLIDSSVFIDWERGRINIEKKVEGRGEEDFFLSVISASELLHGVHRAVDPDIRTKRSAFVEAILSRFSILSIDLSTARIHAEIWAELSAQGNRIGPHDSWLAATCLAHGLAMITGNIREFGRVPGLSVETWTN